MQRVKAQDTAQKEPAPSARLQSEVDFGENKAAEHKEQIHPGITHEQHANERVRVGPFVKSEEENLMVDHHSQSGHTANGGEGGDLAAGG